MLTREGETGVDVICIRVEMTDRDNRTVCGRRRPNKQDLKIPTVMVDGWQCKGGYWKLSMGEGVMKTSRDLCIETGRVENISDKLLNGVFAKAEVGLLTII
mmetsp:Transcript_7793/g.11599  ORF Transcript_7793/g.11599 Transcript_7793/m.11599 type:complete len:101 (-) Transcript_7793:466-768(-)